jgi:hypothetical protein
MTILADNIVGPYKVPHTKLSEPSNGWRCGFVCECVLSA